MAIVSGVLGAVLLFGLVVFVHELGHFLFARMMGVGVEEFALGWGPLLKSWRGKKTKWSLRAIPLGGYCLIQGMAGEENEGDKSEGKPKRGDFLAAGLFARILVLLGGSIFNLLLAVLLLFGISKAYGTDRQLVLINEITPSIQVQGVIPSGGVIASIATEDRRIEAVEWPSPEAFHQTIETARSRGVKVHMDITWMGARFGPLVYAPIEGETPLSLTLSPVLTGRVAALGDWGAGKIEGVGPWHATDGEPLTGPVLQLLDGLEATLVLESESGLRVVGVPREEVRAWLEAGERPSGISANEVVVWADGVQGANALEGAASPTVQVRLLKEEGLEVIDLERGILMNSTGWEAETTEAGWGEAWERGTKETAFRVFLIGAFIRDLFKGKKDAVEGVSGPVGIFKISYQAAQMGLQAALGFAAFLSINLGLINLLPIPAMDGGRIILQLVSAFISFLGFRMSPRVEERINAVGFAFLILLFVLVSIRDLIAL
ncbi:site-2 protease family protein [bacterium]|nr:site-2 protease family protein [bacterium]